MFNGPLEACDGRKPLRLRDRLKAAGADPGAKFERFNCGEMGDEIYLHADDHCAPNQNDLLVLSEAGAAREAFLDAVFKASGLGTGFAVTAMGCDGKTLGIAVMSGGTAECNEDRLRTVANEIGAKLRSKGFEKLQCEPDGPDISLK